MELQRVLVWKGWSTYQAEGQRYESTSWFRLENNIFENPIWDELTTGQFRTFVFLLSYTSRRAHKTGRLELNEKTICRLAGITRKMLDGTLASLHRLGVAEIVPANDESPETRTETAPSIPGDCTEEAPSEHGEETALRDGTERDVTERNETEDKPGVSAESSLRRMDVPDLKEFWNAHSGLLLKKVEKVTPDRQKKWRARWVEKPDRAYWVAVITRLSNSPFCCGGGSTGWVASVDFFLRPNTHVKALEGQYDAAPLARRQSRADIVSANNMDLLRRVRTGEA